MLIKDANRMNMYNLKNELNNFGVDVVGFKVDCIFFKIPNNNNIMKYIRKSITIEDIKINLKIMIKIKQHLRILVVIN